MAPDSSYGLSRVVHHKDFYLRGGDMTVLVENHLYRIHSYFFDRESLFFRQKINGSGSNDAEERGSTDHNAYTLEDVKSEDFARFLWVFYNPKYSLYEAPLDTWLSILKLANRWTFDNVKELAVRELEKIDIEAVEKIAIYHDNSISRLYLIPSYISVCKRDKPMSFTEGMKLGMETVLRVAEARERLRLQASESGIRTPTFEDFEDAEVEVLIRDIFNLGSRPTLNSPSHATSPAIGANGSANGVPKLSPAPPPKANGAAAARASGGSAPDHKGSSVDPLPSFASAMSGKATAAATSASATGTGTQTQTTAQLPQQKPQAPVPSTTTAQAAATSPPPPAADKSKENNETTPQDLGSLPSSTPKSGGAGEPSSLEDSTRGAGSHDVLINKSDVPNAHSNDATAECKDNANDIEKDESGKDNDVASTDAEGGRGGMQGGRNRGGRRGGTGRGRK